MIEKFPIKIQFLGTYVIVMGASNHSGSIKMETSVLTAKAWVAWSQK